MEDSHHPTNTSTPGKSEALDRRMEDEESINPEPESKPSRVYLSTTLSILVIIQLAGLSFVTSFTNGILTVGLPTIARDILLPQYLLLWPSTVGFLATASFLLLGGGVSDAAGPKLVNVLGCVLLTASTLGCGLAHSGIQLIVFRALQGLAYALAYPSSTAIVSLHIRSGPARNVGFACIGFAMCIGFAGGLFVGALGWRAGLYAGAGISLILLGLGALTLPSDSRTLVRPASLENLMNDIDWIGAGIGTAFLALISTVLAMLSAKVTTIKHPGSICMLIVSIMLVPAFALWMRRQEAHKRPALIPNSIWTTQTAFTCICVMILIAGGLQNCMEILCSLIFQNIQGLSPIDASLRLLPELILGGILELCTGRLIHRTRPIWPALLSTVLSAGSPLVMAFINPAWPYWYASFWAVLLSCLACDVIYTIGLLIASDAFPEERQGLAGALFNVFYFLGSSVGMAVVNVVLAAAPSSSEHSHGSERQMVGFRDSFWTLFSMAVVSAIVGAVGLRKLGRIGQRKG